MHRSRLRHMATPKGGETAGRLRAARGYAGLKQPELADKLGVSVETLSRMENGRTTVSDKTRYTVAEICGVPGAFMDVGFDPLRRPITDAERRLIDFEELFEERLGVLEEQAAVHGWVTSPQGDPAADVERELEEMSASSERSDDDSEAGERAPRAADQ